MNYGARSLVLSYLYRVIYFEDIRFLQKFMVKEIKKFSFIREYVAQGKVGNFMHSYDCFTSKIFLPRVKFLLSWEKNFDSTQKKRSLKPFTS